LKGSPKVLLWSAEAAAVFAASKGSLVAALPLSQPAPKSAISLAVYASNSHVGGVLKQTQNGQWADNARLFLQESFAKTG